MSRLAIVATALVVFVATAAVLALTGVGTLGGGDEDSPRDGRLRSERPSSTDRSRSTKARVARLELQVRERPADAKAWTALAAAQLQRGRETAAGADYDRAERALERALRLNPRLPDAYTERAILRFNQHEFAKTLADARRARRLAPEVLRPRGIEVDALLELGRYAEAERTLQRLIDLKPSLDAYARVAAVRELRGDLDGATEAMRLAVSAGGEAPENAAYVQSLLGELLFLRGRRAQAIDAFETALYKFPGHARASAGLARAQVAAGDLGAAERTLAGLVRRAPLPQYVLSLGEVQRAAGKDAVARRNLTRGVELERELIGRGVAPDADTALVEADHGDVTRGVRAGRAAWGHAQSVRAADALGWALTRAGRPVEGLRYARRALRLGSREPSFLFHAGMAAKGAGRADEAKRLLRRALATEPRFAALYPVQARRALAELT
jgi:tetratricopeptide (TPR) repeat protein